MRRFLFIFILFPTLLSAQFYVSTNGSDANNGTFALPFKNIQRGVDVVSATHLSNVLYIGPGIYTQNVVIKSNKNSPIFIVMTSLTNTKRAVLRGRRTAITISNANAVFLSNLNLAKQTNSGINVSDGSTNVRVTGCTIYSNWRGIQFKNTKRCRALRNTLTYNSKVGIYLTNVTSILSNNIQSYSTNGISYVSSTNCSSVSDVITHNSGDGLHTRACKTFTVNWMTATRNYSGIAIRELLPTGFSSNIIVRNSNLSTNTGVGILVTNQNTTGPAIAYVYNCTVRSNHQAGINASLYSSVYVRNSDISANTVHGIKDVYNSSSLSHCFWISNCTINSNIGGGGVYSSSFMTSLTMMRCTLKGNSNGIFGPTMGGGASVQDNVYIFSNIFYGSTYGGMYWGNALTASRPLSYKIYGNTFTRNPYGIYLRSGKFGKYLNNIFYTNSYGIYFNGANLPCSNYVAFNTFQSWYSNYGVHYFWGSTSIPTGANISQNKFIRLVRGVNMNGVNVKLTMQSNLFLYCTNGIYGTCSGGAIAQSNYITRNAFFGNVYGIYTTGPGAVTGLLIKNNVFVSNRIGTYLFSGTNFCKNNIVYNNIGRGFWTAGSNCCTYNETFGNGTNYSGTSHQGTGSISNNPQFASYDYTYLPNFLYLGNTSPCIDAGDPTDSVPIPSGNGRVDMGWLEWSPPSIFVTNTFRFKTSMITHTIHYTNYKRATTHIVIEDYINRKFKFVTNSSSSPAGWTNQWSTNKNPDQGWYSSDYKTVQPTSTNVRWVRFKSASIAGSTGGNLVYKVKLK